jgi:hypothetical protein
VTAVAGDRDRLLVRRDGGGPGPVTCGLAVTVSVNVGANAGADEPEDYGKEQVTRRLARLVGGGGPSAERIASLSAP